MIPVPHAALAWTLVPFLPGLWLLARWLLGNLDLTARRILTPILAVCLFIFFTHVLSLIFHSYFIGMPATFISLGILGYFSTIVFRSENIPARGEKIPGSFWSVLLLSTIFIGPAVFRFNIYDEDSVPGHMSTASEILNGYYPPAYLAEPSLELRYHYGYDILTATTQFFLQLRVDQAIDLLEILTWVMMLPCIWLAAERFFAAGSGTLASIIVPWGTGLTFVGKPARYPLMGNFSIHGSRMALPLINNFFQKPWALAVPAMILAIILVAHCARETKSARRAFGALAITIASLAIIEAAVFGIVVLACGLCLLYRFLRYRSAREFAAGLVILIAALVGRTTHGMFIPVNLTDTGIAHTGLHWSFSVGGIGFGWFYSILWNCYSLGFRLPLGLIGIYFAGRRASIWILMMCLSAFLLNALRYAYTNDIIKFETLVSIPLSFGTAACLSRWRFAWRSSPQWRDILFSILVPALCAQGLIFIGALWSTHPVNAQRSISPYWTLRYPISGDEAHAINWLRREVHPPENLYHWPFDSSGEPIAADYCSWGGLPTVWPQNWDLAMGMNSSTLDARIALHTMEVSLYSDPAKSQADQFIKALRGQNVVWIVISEEDQWLLPYVTPYSGEVNRFGSVRIFKFR